MSNHSHDRLPLAIAMAVFITALQIGGVIGVGWLAYYELMSPTTPFGESPETSLAVVCRGEIFYLVSDLKVNETRVALRALDLKTGKVRVVSDPCVLAYRGLTTDGERVWAVGDSEIMEVEGSHQKIHRPKRAFNRSCGWTFLYEGRPALIDRDAYLVERLLVFEDGDWQDKGRIAMPGEQWQEIYDERLGGKVLVPPEASVTQTPAPVSWRSTNVIPGRNTYHIFQNVVYTNKPAPAMSYRRGFDFVSTISGDQVVSALAPENAPALATGWIRTGIDNTGPRGLVATGDDVFVATPDGQTWELKSPEHPRLLPSFELAARLTHQQQLPSNEFILDRMTGRVYALKQTSDSGIEVYEFDGKSTSQPLFRVEGHSGWCVRFWGRTLLRAFGVMALGNLLLVWLGTRLMAGADEFAYSFGTETVRLASLKRRFVAKVIDVTVWFAPFAAFVAWWLASNSYETIYQYVVHELVELQFNSDPKAMEPLLFAGLIAGIFTGPLFLITLWMEAYTGLTPGKWLCGIRAVRTTLRPINFNHALVRSLLLWFDTPLLLWGVSGTCCLICTERRQRLGDLVADTIVINRRSQVGDPPSSP